jgi:hypothetical protein
MWKKGWKTEIGYQTNKKTSKETDRLTRQMRDSFCVIWIIPRFKSCRDQDTNMKLKKQPNKS